MPLPSSAVRHYQEQQNIAAAALGDAMELWGRMGENFDASWSPIAGDLFATVVEAQTSAAASGLRFVPRVLEEQDLDASALAEVNPARFAGGTRDGRPAETLLHGAVYQAKREMLAGATTAQALSSAGVWLSDVVLDVVRDADRQAVGAAMTVTPAAQGWVRMLNPPSCKFCVVLAGKWYRWNQGFHRTRTATAATSPARSRRRPTTASTPTRTSAACRQPSRTACSARTTRRRSGTAATSTGS